MHAVLQHLDEQLVGLEGMPAALLARDGFLFAVLWQTKSRGCNAGVWRLENLKLPAGRIHCSLCRQHPICCCPMAGSGPPFLLRCVLIQVKMQCLISTQK